MAGWQDLEVDGVIRGELPAGYIMSIAFINTYINAINEKAFYSNVETGGALKGKLIEIDTTKPFLWSSRRDLEIPKVNPVTVSDFYNPVMLLFWRVGEMMQETWVHQETWDDPLSTTGVTDDLTSFWSQQEMKDLITEEIYDILIDPWATPQSNLQRKDIFNAIYTIYSQVFLYIWANDMPSAIFSGAANLSGSIDERLEGVTEAQANTFSDVTIKGLYDNLGINPVAVFSKGVTRIGSNEVGQLTYNFGPETYNYDYELTGMRWSLEFTVNSLNHDGDFVELERKEAIWITNNFILDTNLVDTSYQQLVPDFPQVNATVINIPAAQNPVRVMMTEPSSSTLEVDGWHFITGIDPPEYQFSSGDYIFPIVPGAFETSAKAARLLTGNTASGEVDADLYYNLNVEGMIYNTLPPA